MQVYGDDILEHLQSVIRLMAASDFRDHDVGHIQTV